MTEELEKYILDHIEAEPQVLKKLYRDTNVNVLRPRMMSGHLQGRILKMFTRMTGAKKVLELGTFTGYSAQCFAEGLEEGGVVYTIDHNDELEEFTTAYFEQSPYRDKIRYLIGDALETVAKMPDSDFDLVFIDADKREYLKYYEAVLPKLRKGGFILADNTLWDGKVVEPLAHNDEQTRGVMEFNDFVAKDERVEAVIIPLRDGLTILRKN
jgi:predicted O-methyltransferase YrrM